MSQVVDRTDPMDHRRMATLMSNQLDYALAYARLFGNICDDEESFLIDEVWIGKGNEQEFLSEVDRAVRDAIASDPEGDYYTHADAAAALLKERWSDTDPEFL